MIVSYTMEGDKGLRNAECRASLDTMEQEKKNTNKSTMKSLVLLHVVVTRQRVNKEKLLLLLHNQHR